MDNQVQCVDVNHYPLDFSLTTSSKSTSVEVKAAKDNFCFSYKHLAKFPPTGDKFYTPQNIWNILILLEKIIWKLNYEVQRM